ncbi:MAG: molybdenum cofactor biosynthesis protein MoaE [Candidatus Bathyarchaeota archaeon]|nr:molybdenum cofactor biosynthesis protein MoaE [Candidatus Bathyarchaeota archaeon]
MINAGVHAKGTFTLQDAINNIRKDPNYPKAGAIATFIGVVRGETLENERVEKLTIEAYEEKANEVLNQICNDLMHKQGIINVQIHHLLGEFMVGDDLVYVVVAGSHRQDVFPVLQEAVERYKSEVPVFKKEHIKTETGSSLQYWVSEKEHRHDH